MLSLRDGVVPPTANHERAEPELAIDVVAGEPRKLAAAPVVSNSFGFGGHNASLVLTPNVDVTAAAPRRRPAGRRGRRRPHARSTAGGWRGSASTAASTGAPSAPPRARSSSAPSGWPSTPASRWSARSPPPAPTWTRGLASLVAWGRVAKALSDASGTVPVILTVFGPVRRRAGAAAGPGRPRGHDRRGLRLCERAPGRGVLHRRRRRPTPTSAAPTCTPAAAAWRRWWCSTRTEAAGAVADLLSYLPSNHLDEPPFWPTDDPLDRPSKVAAGVVPERPTASYDVRTVIGDVCDVDTFLEVRAALATNVVTGLRPAGRHAGRRHRQPARAARPAPSTSRRPARRPASSSAATPSACPC